MKVRMTVERDGTPLFSTIFEVTNGDSASGSECVSPPVSRHIASCEGVRIKFDTADRRIGIIVGCHWWKLANLPPQGRKAQNKQMSSTPERANLRALMSTFYLLANAQL